MKVAYEPVYRGDSLPAVLDKLPNKHLEKIWKLIQYDFPQV